MAPPAAYAADSDADDEYERSLMTSPTVATDDDTSQTESDPPSTENTPTTFGNLDGDSSSPRTIITEWTAEECAGFIKVLGLPQYCNNFLENEIVGEALIALGHEELKEMGVASVGHRLTILKGIYDTKIKQDIPIESDHYVPLSANASLNNKKATQEDISRIIRSIKLRDERILAYEAKIEKITEEYRKLREELLPVFRMAKERSQPLPSPIHYSEYPDIDHSHDALASPVSGQSSNTLQSTNGNGLSRRPSRKAVWLNSTPKNASPTYPHTIPEGKMMPDLTILDPSAAAIAASSHLTAGLGTDRGPSASPNPNLPSPTSPNTYHNQPAVSARGGYAREPAPSIAPSTRSNFYGEDLPQFAYGVPDNASTYRGAAPTPTPGRSRGGTRGDDEPATPATGGGSVSGSSSTPSVEIFKSFRVSMDDPCHKVLPAALKKYNINADWRQYALYIVFGDQERCLGLEEKPLILFKQLDKEGKKPMFMLRRHAAPMEGHTGTTSAAQGIPSVGLGGGGGGQIQLPGGVL